LKQIFVNSFCWKWYCFQKKNFTNIASTWFYCFFLCILSM